MSDQPPASHSDLLKAILLTLSENQILTLCQLFPKDTALGEALSQALQQWDIQSKNTAATKEDLVHSLNQVLKADKSFPIYFYNVLRSFMKKNGFDPDTQKGRSDLYKKAGIAQNTYSTLMSRSKEAADNKRHDTGLPKRDNVIKLGLALELNFFEMKYLLASAGISFSPALNPSDYVIAQCIMNGVYRLEDVDGFLYDHDLPTLGDN